MWIMLLAEASVCSVPRNRLSICLAQPLVLWRQLSWDRPVGPGGLLHARTRETVLRDVCSCLASA